MNDHIENFNSEPRWRHFGHLLSSKEWETGNQLGRTIQPKYGVYLHLNMVKKKVPYAELKIFSAYTLIRTRLYDSAASTASPLGSAVSLAIKQEVLL